MKWFGAGAALGSAVAVAVRAVARRDNRQDGPTRWLAVTVDADPDTVPRQVRR